VRTTSNETNNGPTSFDLHDQWRLIGVLMLTAELNDGHLFVFVSMLLVMMVMVLTMCRARLCRWVDVDRFVPVVFVVLLFVDLFFVVYRRILHRFRIERIDMMNIVEMPFDRARMRKLVLTQRTAIDRFSSSHLLFHRRWTQRWTLRILQRWRIRPLPYRQAAGRHLRVDAASMHFGHMLPKVATRRIHQAAFVALKRSFV
jgi:hypothetical protein